MAFYGGSTTGAGASDGNEHSQYFNNPNFFFDDSPPYEPYDNAAFYQDWPAGPQSSSAMNPAMQSAPPTAPVSMAAPPNMLAFSGAPPSAPASATTGPIGLTDAQRRDLQQIAMPSHLQYHSPKSQPSPDSAVSAQKSISSPDGLSSSSNSLSRKRKSSEDEDDDDDLDQPVKKTAHNMIEKRYRTNLNDKIAALRDSVPSLRIMSKSAKGEDTTEDREELHGLTPAHKLNKATVLSKATEYIRHLEKRNTRLTDENTAMQARIAAFEKLFMSGAMNGSVSPLHQQSPTPVMYPQEPGYVQSPMATPSRDPPGLIQVPEDMKRIIAAQIAAGQPYPVPQQQYRPPTVIRQQQIQQHQQQMQARGWQNAGPYFGKLMVGSLAGLMLFEAVREHEQSNETSHGRGLFAIPLQLIQDYTPSFVLDLAGYQVASVDVFYYFKFAFLILSVWWACLPSLASPHKPNPRSGKESQAQPRALPSLASPIHVRRQAWLTAIQTVWVPRHNFFLEAAALGLKTLKLSLRNLIGIHGYQMLTGLTEEQECARVKAWEIALDAQLAGGDCEISKSRLTLTLLASGTLPDSPLRMMLKALHIRILLWEPGSKGSHYSLVNTLASKFARSRWNEAKQLHKVSTQLRRAGRDEETEETLPDHLAHLLEQDADDVLNDAVIQRAHNLTWNRPTDYQSSGADDGLDMVVDDVAVRSPMDGVAAWWSTLSLQAALAENLLVRDEGEDGDISQLVEERIMLAIKVAPVGSMAQNRALVARAVLSNEKRGVNIAAVIQAVGPPMSSASLSEMPVSPFSSTDDTPPASPRINIPSSMMAESEIYTCLQCAKAIAHLQKYTPPDEPVAVYPIIEKEVHVSNDMSLLGYTAAFTLMERLSRHEFAAEACSAALERLSGTLRIWIGKASGLEPDVKREMVERCLAVTRGVVGMDFDEDGEKVYSSPPSDREQAEEDDEEEEEEEEEDDEDEDDNDDNDANVQNALSKPVT